MKPATQKEHHLRRKLLELATRGVGGEATNARAAVADLERRYDFSAEIIDTSADIFAGCNYAPCFSGEAHALFEFDAGEEDVASFVKWAFGERFNINGSIRTGRGRSAIMLEAHRADIAGLKQLAEKIRGSFASLWSEFAKAPGVQPGARRPFLLGLYDGMMDDARGQGQALPPVKAPVAKRTKRRKAIQHAPGLSVHPYELALEMGRKIRMARPLREIAQELSDCIAAQIEDQRSAA